MWQQVGEWIGGILGSAAAACLIALLSVYGPKAKEWLNAHTSAAQQSLITIAAEKAVMLAIMKLAPGYITKPEDWASRQFINAVTDNSVETIVNKFPDTADIVQKMVGDNRIDAALRDIVVRVLPDVAARAAASPVTPAGPLAAIDTGAVKAAATAAATAAVIAATEPGPGPLIA